MLSKTEKAGKDLSLQRIAGRPHHGQSAQRLESVEKNKEYKK
jgi:hypothetical protein